MYKGTRLVTIRVPEEHHIKPLDSSVGIATRPLAGRPGLGSLQEQQILPSSQNPDQLWGHPTSYLMGNDGVYLRG
jgi:hypothetical protein